jgi:hypothetical protein
MHIILRSNFFSITTGVQSQGRGATYGVLEAPSGEKVNVVQCQVVLVRRVAGRRDNEVCQNKEEEAKCTRL